MSYCLGSTWSMEYMAKARLSKRQTLQIYILNIYCHVLWYGKQESQQLCHASVLLETFYYGQGQAIQALQVYQVTDISTWNMYSHALWSRKYMIYWVHGRRQAFQALQISRWNIYCHVLWSRKLESQQLCDTSVLPETFYYGQGQPFLALQEFQVTHISRWNYVSVLLETFYYGNGQPF